MENILFKEKNDAFPIEEPPLVVDLDGTLLRSDLLIETALVFFHEQPHRVLTVLQWLRQGKAALKSGLAHATKLDVSILPYDNTVIELLKTERERGRYIVLATASHRQLADQVAKHLRLFDEVVATDASCNLSGSAKRDMLVQMFGDRGFDYAGNSNDDLLVWSAARQAYVVNASSATERRARKVGNVVGVLGSGQTTLRDWGKALRVHQWLKNLLIFVPLLAAHRYTDPLLMFKALIAFFCFSLCASSVYVLNDLLDLCDDRHHIRKRSRPFASGKISIQSGLILFPALLLAAFGISLWKLPTGFTLLVGIYYVLTLTYSLALKRCMVIDAITLAGLYTLRIIAGGVALDIPLTFWLLGFSMFIFLSLAFVKRYAEIFQGYGRGSAEKIRGRGYFPSDLQMIASLGTASGYMAVMVLALYVSDLNTAQLYRRPELIWLACPLVLTWISRVWMLTHRGDMNEDPIIFAVRDPISLMIAGSVILVFGTAR